MGDDPTVIRLQKTLAERTGKAAGLFFPSGTQSNLAALIDLRSDTVTRPGAAMLQAMATAPVGDDVMGDDPTVIRLQKTLAERTGKAAG
ncbi:hypothetical protein CTI14_61205, partial [Methylobacterium radiotolerans]